MSWGAEPFPAWNFKNLSITCVGLEKSHQLSKLDGNIANRGCLDIRVHIVMVGLVIMGCFVPEQSCALQCIVVLQCASDVFF